MTENSGWPRGVGLLRYDVLDSTNEEARRLAANGEIGPVWIAAREQSAGRGRRGREWASAPGNLFATLLLQADHVLAPQLGFVSGLAVAEMIDVYATPADVALKWPNDVLLRGQKASGILLEAVGEGVVAIGIGVNLAHHPSHVEFPASSIAAVTGIAPTPDDALLRLAGFWSTWYEVWRGMGFAPVRNAWLKRAAGIGGPIKVRLAAREMDGVFETIDGDGALLLRTPDGKSTRVMAGEVYFGS